MTPAEFKEARQKLGLTQSQMANVLDSDARAIRAIESDPETSKHRRPAPRMARLIKAYLSGYRPPDWPG